MVPACRQIAVGDRTEKEVAPTTGRERVFRGLESGLMPARRGLVGQEQFGLGQIPRSLPRWRQEARQEIEASPLRGRNSWLIWGIPVHIRALRVLTEESLRCTVLLKYAALLSRQVRRAAGREVPGRSN